jgi:hypothetical protein
MIHFGQQLTLAKLDVSLFKNFDHGTVIANWSGVSSPPIVPVRFV